MAGTSQYRRRRQRALALSAVLALLLSCDKRALPTQPSGSQPPTPGPQAQRSTGPIAFVSDRDGTDRIYLANDDGSAVTPLVAGWEPAWARNGRQLAFRTVRGFDIRVISVDGSGDRVIADRGSQPAWSPDGRALVFVSWRGDSEIDVVNVDGSNRRSLFNSGGFVSFKPAWSPDGQRIVFYIGTYIDWCFGLWIVNADGSNARQLGGRGVLLPSSALGSCFFGSEAALSDGTRPAWSPDGSEIAFVSDGGGGSAQFSIHVAQSDGSGRRLRVPAPATDPDWTSDGRLIYTKGAFDSPTRIFISDGGTERQLIPDATAPARATYRDWSAVWLR